MVLLSGLRKLLTWRPSRRRDVLRYVRGYAVEWNTRYPCGEFGEQKDRQFTFLPGSFDKCLARCPDIFLSRDLDHQTVYARTSDCTLQLEADNFGLLADIELLDTPHNWELCRMIDAGKIRGWSHYAKPMVSRFLKADENGVRVFEYSAADLSELTLVIAKRPRAMTRKTPIFLAGGPGTTESADVL